MSREDGRVAAAQVAAAIRSAGGRWVLVTAPHLGAGVSTLCNTLEDVWALTQSERYVVLRWRDMESVGPEALEAKLSDPEDPLTTVVVEGPVALHSDALSAEWIARFDASFVIARKRLTRRRALRQTTDWLRAVGITPVGLIWNEAVK